MEMRQERDMWSPMRNEVEFRTGYVKGRMTSENPRKQILVPKSLRERVTGVAHDSLSGGHLGVKKTEDRIQINFFWPDLHEDATSFCRSCDICQKIVARGSVPQAPLGTCQ